MHRGWLPRPPEPGSAGTVVTINGLRARERHHHGERGGRPGPVEHRDERPGGHAGRFRHRLGERERSRWPTGTGAPGRSPTARRAGSSPGWPARAVETAIATSQDTFPAGGSANTVVLARSDFFADALAGGPLAAFVDGPLLITPGAGLSSTLDPEVQSEIQRVLKPGGTVYILGGSLALSPAIDTALQALGFTTQRLAGADEYATRC